MQIAVRFSGGSRSDFGSHAFEEVVLGALERFQHLLKNVQVYFEDINGPRGGVDKQCRCVLNLKRMPPIVIQDEDENARALINRVAERAAYTLSQKSDRKNRRNIKGAASVRHLPQELPE